MKMKENQVTHKVVIVDDHALFAGSLEKLINSFQDFKTLYHLRNGKELKKKLKSDPDHPHIVLLDINMPVMNGFETAKWLSKTYPDIKFLALTMDDEEISILKMLKRGAHGYLLKDIQPENLHFALKEVLAKGYYHSEKVSETLMQAIHPKFKNQSLELKKNEITFLKLACSEMTYKEIAEVMNLSPKTIDGYRQDLFQKLRVKNRVGLVMYALKNRIITL